MCISQTLKNTQCKNKSVAGSDYCRKHQPAVAAPNVDEVTVAAPIGEEVIVAAPIAAPNVDEVEYDSDNGYICKNDTSEDVESLLLSPKTRASHDLESDEKAKAFQKMVTELNEQRKSALDLGFTDTICSSERITNDIAKLVEGMGRTMKDFEKAMVDDSFEDNELPEDRDTFSVALPFQYTYVGDVAESELPDLLMYYLKEVICNNDEEAWIWLRSYLANIIHQPDSRTEVMLILYSQEKRVENLSDVFGERGGTSVVSKRVVWFEEMTEKKAVFRACMDRMKTAITEKRTTYKPLYQELHETNNTNEYIACTNHLVGVLADRQTVLHVSDKHREDHAFYTKLRANMNQDGCNKFASYLKQFTTQLPMRIHKTTIYESMLSNGAEGIDTFINGVKSGEITFQFQHAPKFWYASKEDLYEYAYIHWCESQGDKPITFNHFKEKFQHYNRSCEYTGIRVGDARMYAFKVPVDWNKQIASDEEPEFD
ncbi:hypothetical protein H257_12103 [Aphanomyces astaci]|uniref:DNA primase/nucleoside triphosphatase C-terminal domain-containing protein n=1 Tax=Aphanomyces astaci TaxID=112090 RepID=W4G051_APHAT|nr:hypothetical protein H257_12103 [Aphanomyces astaci]ETV73067.1 hypothetical protein H257_12103 [Aphanomyces astaci]|eukprot:XP_009837516.1 hypothetical protein H257_12103 [Aphanomyces astaci]